MSKITDHASLESERALVSGALAYGAEVVDAANLPAAAFFGIPERAWWAALLRLRDRGVAWSRDPYLLIEQAATTPDEKSALESSLMRVAGGSHGTAHPQLAASYAETVRRHATTRAALLAASEANGLASQGIVGDELVGELLRRFGLLNEERAGLSIGGRDFVRRGHLAYLERLERGESEGSGMLIPTGLTSLDNLLGGWMTGELHVIGARPGMGKSSFAMTALYGALRAGVGVDYYSPETSERAMWERLAARETGHSVTDYRRGRVDVRQHGSLSQSLAFQRGDLWHVTFERRLSAADIVRRARSRLRRLKTKLLIVDYLNKLSRPRRVFDRRDAVDQNIRELEDFAATEDVAVLLFAQLGRSVEERPLARRRPERHDFKETGELEQSARVLAGLNRPREWDKKADPRLLEFCLIKVSQGQSGIVECDWNGPLTLITDKQQRELWKPTPPDDEPF